MLYYYIANIPENYYDIPNSMKEYGLETCATRRPYCELNSADISSRNVKADFLLKPRSHSTR